MEHVLEETLLREEIVDSVNDQVARAVAAAAAAAGGGPLPASGGEPQAQENASPKSEWHPYV